ncbi:uncharacterized protein BT62DRAFT_1001773 [Guyanagaster necrorhizus]|uniref:Uncharacterized protein n=1 Tax=Guyanagaster necrorhizus TaxID=856835 RepID=A0A9P7W1M5_9AGAR|nr:uncharacterized protein BT62DRAFT_1001773 [Guyanagaster necrorhizus MCA 3950]KAG7450924.1 hypothetical protein BT62DRAFT_1001773 [Guyanagaster necrorhizus MCA 3950]
MPRGPQTNATCTSDFTWADNAEELNPCSLVAYVMASCLTDTYYVWALSNDTHYDRPGDGAISVTPCSCSWAAYNLFGACTACQAGSHASWGWAAYKANCGDDLSNTTFFPYDKDYTLPTAASIPYWAAQNPSIWNNGEFDTTEAKNLSLEGHADLSGPSNDTSNGSGSSRLVGAIVGGVVGGVTVVAGAAVVAFFLFRRHRRHRAPKILEIRPGHFRSQSDLTQKNGPAILYSDSAGQRPSSSLTQATHTILSHSGEGTTPSYFGSIHGSSAFMSPPTSPTRQLMSPPPMIMNPEDIIHPFTATPLMTASPSYTVDRKGEGGTDLHTHYQRPSISSVDPIADHSATNPESASRQRINPPAYSMYEEESPHVIHQTPDGTGNPSRAPTPNRGHRSEKRTSQDAAVLPRSPVASTMQVRNTESRSSSPGHGAFGGMNAVRSSRALSESTDIDVSRIA